MKQKLLKIYEKIEKIRNSKVIVYVTGDRANMEAQIAPDSIDILESTLKR